MGRPMLIGVSRNRQSNHAIDQRPSMAVPMCSSSRWDLVTKAAFGALRVSGHLRVEIKLKESTSPYSAACPVPPNPRSAPSLDGSGTRAMTSLWLIKLSWLRRILYAPKMYSGITTALLTM